MNVYLGGVIGFLWIGGVVRWAMHRMDAAAQLETKPAGLSGSSASVRSD
jgi:hypothetical protein